MRAARRLHSRPPMKSVFACLLLISSAHADQAPTGEAAGMRMLGSIEVVEALDTARVQRASGAVLALSGVAMALTATALGGYAASLDRPLVCLDNCSTRDHVAEASLGLAVTGSLLMSIGIPLWAVGIDKVRLLEKRARLSGFVGQIGKNGGGASIRLLF